MVVCSCSSMGNRMLGNMRVDRTSCGFSMGPTTGLDARSVVRNIPLVWHLLHAYLSLCESC